MLHHSHLLFGQIILFTDIGFQVVKLDTFFGTAQLPLTQPHGLKL